MPHVGKISAASCIFSTKMYNDEFLVSGTCEGAYIAVKPVAGLRGHGGRSQAWQGTALLEMVQSVFVH